MHHWMTERTKFIQKTLGKRPYSVIVWPLSGLYIIVMFIVYSYIYNGHPHQFFVTFAPSYTIPFVLFTILISIQIGVLITLISAKVNEVKSKSLGLGVIGIIMGSLAAGCPGCFFGLFPLILGFFGVGGTLAILPWSGIEFQVITVILLLTSTYMLAAETDLSCKIKR